MSKWAFLSTPCALIAYLNDENGAETVENVFNQTLSGKNSILMSIVDLLEVYYGMVREIGAKKTDET